MVPLVAALSSASGTRLVIPLPELLVIGGVSVPIVSALAGMLGVALGQLLAPAPMEPLSLRRRLALGVTLHALIVATVILTGQQVLVALGWGIGLGFSGLTVAQLLGSQAIAGIKVITDAAIAWAATKLGRKEDDSVG